MFKKLELGVVYNYKGMIINHRSLVKVLLNPFFRFFGYNIATIYDKEKNALHTPTIIKCKKMRKLDFLYKNNIRYTIKKERMLI